MAVWLHLTRHALRTASRRPEIWRARVIVAILVTFAATWAAAAPQAHLSLGERLSLSFDTSVVICLGLAATCGLRRAASIVEDAHAPLRARDRHMARIVANGANSAASLAPAVPVFALLAGLEVISTRELTLFAALISAILVGACLIPSFAISVFAISTVCLVALPWRRTQLEIILCGIFTAHLALKAVIARSAVLYAVRYRRNFMHEAATPLTDVEFAALHRNLLGRRFATPMIAIILCNIALALAIADDFVYPVSPEQKLALGAALITGAVLLALDSSALAWCGLLAGITSAKPERASTLIFTGIIGAPWALAWMVSAFHTGEALSMNEGAAYFVLWSGVGVAISWTARTQARQRLERSLRSALSEHN